MFLTKVQIILFIDDQNAQPSTINVLSAATTLALALQQCKMQPSIAPDKETTEVISAWLDAFMPVSFSFLLFTLNTPDSGIIRSPRLRRERK